MFIKKKPKEKTKQTSILHYKSVKVDTPNIDETSMTVSGYLASFENIDNMGDRLHKGCFTKSLQEHGVESTSPRKILFCWQHRTDVPIGQFTKLEEDDKGLYFEAKLDDIPIVRETIIPQYKSGTLNQHSIGYCYVKTEFNENEEDGFVCEVYEVELYEGSVVTIGCNENTPFLGFKSLDKNSIEQIEEQYKELEKLTEKLSKFDRLKINTFFNSLMNAAKSSTSDAKPPKLTDDKSKKKSINELFKQKNK
ncbi:MAG: HK97 family phage prohead protease [Prevotellaceae bacterium]|jgi:HK97 family phage prohead protease|nr:HK97 family phage prohead protease [Prevotellaceae bacterium]